MIDQDTKGNPMEAPSDADRLWAATVIDCEGCTSIKKTGPVGPSLVPYYEISVHVGNTFWQMIEDLRLAFGGSMTVRKRVGNHKIVYLWRVHNVAARNFIQAIRPFIRYKTRQADLLMEFWDNKPSFRGLQKGQSRKGSRVPIEEMRRRHECYLLMSKYNKTGAPAETKRGGTLAGETIVRTSQ